jgi:hypothetical protein
MQKGLLKGTVQRDFLSPIFSLMESSQAPYLVFNDFSNFASNSVRYSQFLIDSAVFYSGESIFPELFTTESSGSPHHIGGESPFVSIICTNSRLSFNTESHYSPYWLLRRVTTPRLIYSGESLLTLDSGELFSKTLKDSPLPFKGQWSKKWTIYVEYCSPRIFQKSQKYGLPKALFLTPRCNWHRGVDFLIFKCK